MVAIGQENLTELEDDIMLSKISKSAQQHASRAVSKRSVSTLTHKLEPLEQTLRSISKEKNPLPKLREVRGSEIYREVLAMAKEAQGHIKVNHQTLNDPIARAAAATSTICHALDAVLDLSQNYKLELVMQPSAGKSDDTINAEMNDVAFRTQIKPEHEARLLLIFRTTWKKNDELRQAAIFSVIHPSVAAEIGLIPNKTLTEISRQWGSISPEKQLLKSELLALIDHVNSDTGTFNALNGAELAHAYHGQKLMKNMTQVVSRALIGSISKLTEHPYFGKTDIEAFKGVHFSKDPSGPLRHAWLRAAVGTGKIIPFPQVLSATIDPQQSYAVTKHGLGYTVECHMTVEKACYVDLFHDTASMGQHEILCQPGQKFVVTDVQSVGIPSPERGSSEIERFVLVPTKKNPL